VATRIYVGNLSYTVDSAQLEQVFGAFGHVVDARVVTDRDTGRSKGFGFVEMSSEEETQQAIAGLHGTTLGNRALTVNEARPRTDQDRRR
jgi:RNA recognition motif-containing protein